MRVVGGQVGGAVGLMIAIASESVPIRLQLFGVLLHRIVPMILDHGVELGITLEVIPQGTDELANDNVVCVLLDNAQQEDAILFQVFEEERVKDLVVNGDR